MEQQSSALLLLPPPPSLLSPANTRAAYEPSIDGVLKCIKSTKSLRLDIAIAVPTSWNGTQAPSRTAVFERAQKTLAHTYSLICTAAASQHIELDCLSGVDARAFFLLSAHEPASTLKSRIDDEKPFSGPFVDLTTFIASRRSYDTLFGVESEKGEELLRSFLFSYQSTHRQGPTCRRVPGGLSVTYTPNPSEDTPTSDRVHTSVAVGGTFDHLHVGHKLLLTATALLAEPKASRRNPSQTALLTIGISGDDLLTNKKFAAEMESWEERQQKVADFLESIIVFSAPRKLCRTVEQLSQTGANGKCVRVTFDSSITIDYVEISDPFGPTITDERISALVLSQETKSGGKAINEKRLEKGWSPLEIFEIDVLEVSSTNDEQEDSLPPPAAFESKISSTESRRRIHEARNSGK
jgi:phosphopantetheine adenylyltransferase